MDEKIFWKEGNVLYFVIQGCAFAKLTELYNFFFFFLQRAGFCFVFLKILFIFREREGKVKERERNINVWLPLMLPLLGTWPATQASALTGNQTGDPLVHSLCSIH